eukprot:CAMPEP_0201119308 /NCGR_PEP_ID=MMETSP0850-20130426/3467_1 /ASSEMBLY_ACC=CAM_ASM_000622 /TAXON_ID=183588 /ORGANISM="Pseudo-nitzschia fraudulenta, Strain WWA7" /LENGTH=420 /DNA_ID=CAMNT_0047384971 /DNA_START=144 /DNA_END=1406 /DNA_ORIENTATION=-
MIDAWQAQQRALKEEERRAKTEAAAALKGYRRSGLSEEETKLAALREQERLQKQSAEEQLRGYRRSGLSEEETKLAALREQARLQKQSAEEQLRGYRGQLSAEDAKMAAQKQEELRRKQEQEEQLRHNGVVSSNDLPDRNSLAANSGVVSTMAAEYSSPHTVQPPARSAVKDSPAPPNFAPATAPADAPVVAPSNPFPDPVFANNNNRVAAVEPKNEGGTTPGIAAPATAVAPPVAPPVAPSVTPPVAPSVTPPVAPSVAPSVTPPATVAPPAPIATTEASSSPPALVQVPSGPPPPEGIPSAVVFLFGIITVGEMDVSNSQASSRLTAGYLARADEIAKSVIADDNNSLSPSFQSVSLAYPVASAVEKDYSRTDANRVMVTITISFYAPDEAACNDFRSHVIGRVGAAITNGSFTKLGR